MNATPKKLPFLLENWFQSEVDKLFRSPAFNDEEKVLYQKCPVFDLIKEFTKFLRSKTRQTSFTMYVFKSSILKY